MKRKRKRSSYTRDIAERERRAMTKAALAYKSAPRAEDPSELDRRVFCRDNSADVAAAEAYARERRIERERELAAMKPEKRRGMKIVGGRKGTYGD